jgi:hypothetical protein
MNTETTNPKKKPISLSYIAGGIFGLTAIVYLVKGEYLEFAIWLNIGVAMVLSDMHYLPKGADVKDVPAMPTWRKYLSIILLAIGVAGFGYVVGRDVKAKVQREQAQSSMVVDVNTSNSTLFR